MSEKQESQVQTAIRIPESFLGRADRVAEKMSRPGMRVTRAEVMRLALYQGLARLETEEGRRR